MQVLDSYPLPPGCCALCGSNTVPVIDVGLNTDDLPVELGVEQSGWVYICRACVMHMAGLMGAMAPEDVERLKHRLAASQQNLERTVVTLHAREETIARLIDAPEEVTVHG